MDNSNTFSRLQEDTRSTSKSVLESRAQRDRQMETINNMQKESLQDLNEMIKSLKEILRLNDKNSKARKTEKDVVKELKALQSELVENNKNQNKSYEDTLNILEETNKALERGVKLKERHLDLSSSDFDSQSRALRQQRDVFSDNLDYINRSKKINAEANKSLFDEFSNNLSTLRQQVRDFALVAGVGSLSGKGGQIENYNNLLGQYGYSGMSYDQFKRGSINTLSKNFGGWDSISKFGFNDVLEYMSRLEDLGIANLDLARQQADDVMFGAKYLGLSVDTQSKILKQARDTGNMNLLTESNQALVQIMNAELGVSKQQLEKITSQGTSLAQLSTFFGGEAGTAFTKGLAALESMYGKGTSDSVGNIATRILSNDTSLLQYMPNFYGIQSKLARGDSSALNDIINAVQSSSYIGAVRSSGGKLGVIDKDLMNISTARNSSNTSFSGMLSNIEQQDKSQNRLLDQIKVSATEVIKNLTSWIQSFAPIESLQAIYYPLAIADLMSGPLKVIGKFVGGKLPNLLGKLGFNMESISSALGGGSSSAGLGGSILSLLGKALPWFAIIAGSVKAISDGMDAVNKKDEWGTSTGASFLGGLLGGTDVNEGARMGKNGLKWALVGAGVGFLVGNIPGAIIGGIIGFLAGAGLGAIGGENISQDIDSLLGTTPENSGGVNTAPVTNLSNARRGSFTGKGGSAMGNYPWTLTSPFGYRGSFYTSAGYTNPYHNGVDLAYSEGTPIGSNNSGRVSAVGTDGSRGNYAIINSGDGYEQVYYHMMKPSVLKEGQAINAGQLVGYMGTTGMSTGTHLHFGMRKAGTQDYVDPEPYINSELFNVTERGVADLGVMDENALLAALLSQEGQELRASTLLQKTVDADTVGNYGMGGGDDVVDSVNNGFSSLIAKLDELSQRQDEQEQVLSILASGNSNKLLKW